MREVVFEDGNVFGVEGRSQDEEGVVKLGDSELGHDLDDLGEVEFGPVQGLAEEGGDGKEQALAVGVDR